MPPNRGDGFIEIIRAQMYRPEMVERKTETPEFSFRKGIRLGAGLLVVCLLVLAFTLSTLWAWEGVGMFGGLAFALVAGGAMGLSIWWKLRLRLPSRLLLGIAASPFLAFWGLSILFHHLWPVAVPARGAVILTVLTTSVDAAGGLLMWHWGLELFNEKLPETPRDMILRRWLEWHLQQEMTGAYLPRPPERPKIVKELRGE